MFKKEYRSTIFCFSVIIGGACLLYIHNSNRKKETPKGYGASPMPESSLSVDGKRIGIPVGDSMRDDLMVEEEKEDLESPHKGRQFLERLQEFVEKPHNINGANKPLNKLVQDRMPDLTDLNPNEIVKMAQAVEILCPKGFTTLAESYIRLKTQAHVDYYRGVQNVRSLIHRLLVKRPLWYHSRSNVCNAVAVDFNHEKYITKEECLLSALLQVATETYFINDCNRNNYGRKGNAGEYYTNKALIVGSVGCRFEEEEEHEWRHMYVTEKQNTTEKGYGNRNGNNDLLNMFQEFYDEEFPLCIAKKEFFNYNVFMKNMAKKAEIFFHCGLSHQNEKQIVVFRVVGLGFGWWAPKNVTAIEYELAYQSVFIRALCNVSKIFQSMTIILDFIYPKDNIQNIPIILDPDGKKRRNNIADNNRHYISFFEAYQNKPQNISIYTSKENPASKVNYGDRLYDDEEVFLVTQYAWDSRSYPGNEFFDCGFDASGDPAAACASMITAFQNPEVNIEAFDVDTMKVLELE